MAPTFSLLKRIPVLSRNEETLGATDETRIKHGFYECWCVSVFLPCFIRGSNFLPSAEQIGPRFKARISIKITDRLARRSRSLSRIAIGLLLVLASVSGGPLLGNDDKPIRGVVTKTDKVGAKAALVEIEIGRDEPNVQKKAEAESDGQSKPPEAPAGSLPGMSNSGKKSKTFRGGGSALPGMGGSGMGGGMPGMGAGRGAPRTNKLYAEGEHVILKQSETGDALWGYSETLGKWTKLAIPKQKELLTPTVGGSVGVFTGEDRVYAFSSTTGRWGELKTSAQPTVYNRKIKVQDDDKVFIFSDVTGRWSSNTDAADEPPIVIDNDVPPDTTRPNPLVDVAGRGVVMGDFGGDGRLDVVVSETSEKVKAADLLESLQALYHESERQTILAAAEYRQARQRLGDKDPKTRELRAGLVRLVVESFDRRQQAHRFEAEILRRRLRRVDERLSDREKLKTQIIQHRLEELQNTNVQWDAGADDQAAAREQPTPH
jgi:hypothetical protein